MSDEPQPAALPPISLQVEYDGTDFVGWQVQPEQRSVQGVIEEALAVIHQQPMRITAAGRTDSGVHALAQIVSFVPPVARPLVAYQKGLNALLPHDVAVHDARVRPVGFDARRWAKGKLYRYRIQNGPVRSPLTSRQSWQIFPALDVAAMQRVATVFVGTHDFSAFRASNCEAATTTRTVRRLELMGTAGGELIIEIEATAFLKHMVRNIVGTIAEVGLGARPEASVPEALASLDRDRAGRTAPAQGLCLVRVDYAADAPAVADSEASE